MLHRSPLDKYTAVLFNQDATDRHWCFFQYVALTQTSTYAILHLSKDTYGINFHKWDYWIMGFYFLIDTAKLPSKGLSQLTLPLMMLTCACFPTALPTECIIKLLGVCQSDRWKGCLTMVGLAFLRFWVRLSNVFVCWDANSIPFVVAYYTLPIFYRALGLVLYRFI